MNYLEDQMEPDKNGRHPKYSHLVMYESDSHHGMYLITSPAAEGSLLMGEDDYCELFNSEESRDNGYVWGSDEYLELFEEEK